MKNNHTITNGFQKFLHESGCKPEKIWVDQVLTATELEPTTT